MKVPTRINPQTQVNAVPQGYAQAPQVSGFEGLGNQITNVALDLADRYKLKQDNRQKFDLNKSLVEETNRLQEDFQDRASKADLGAPDFAKTLMSELEVQHQTLIDGFKTQGYGANAVRDFDLQLSQLRKGIFGKALEFQDGSYKVKVHKDLGDSVVGLSQYAAQNPDAIDTVVGKLRENIDLLRESGDLDALTAEKEFESGKAVLLQGAGMGKVAFDPESIIRFLDPKSLEKPAPGPVAKLPASLDSLWQSLIIQESGGRPGVAGPVTKYGQAHGLTQVLDSTGKEMAGELDIPWQPELMRGTSPEAAAYQELIGKAYFEKGLKKYNGDPEKALKFYHGGPNEKQWGPKTRAYAKEVLARAGQDQIDDLPLERVPSVRIAPTWADRGPVPDGLNLDGKTGDKVLDMMDGPQRMELLAQARSALNKNNTELRASIQQRLENENAARLTTGEFAGVPLTLPELTAALGETNGAQAFAQLQAAQRVGSFVKGIKTSSAVTAQAQLKALMPTNTASPSYQVDLQNYEMAEKAVRENFRQRETDPATYIVQNFPAVSSALENAKTPEARKAGWAQMAGAYAQLGIPRDQWLPYSKEQVNAVAVAYDAMPIGQRLAQLKAWGSEMGSMATPFLVQMNGTDGQGPGFDLFMYQQLAGHPDREATILNIFKGKDILRQDPAQRPSAAEINRQFGGPNGLNTAINSLNPEASRLYNEAALGLYIAQGGRTGKAVDGRDAFDKELYADSVRRALGGIKGDKNTGVVKLHSGQPSTILPPTTTKQQWNSFLDRMTPGKLITFSPGKSPPVDAAGKEFNVENLIDNGVFVMRAPGQYVILDPQDDLPLRNKKGQTYILYITPEIMRVP